MADREAQRSHFGFLAGSGAMGQLMRGQDWSASALGPPEAWPQPLKTLIGVMLGSNQPMFVAWGSERTLLYNDAYVEVLGNKHPAALGRDFLEVWHEIRADLLPIVDQALAGEPVHMDDITLVMERKGYAEETHFSFSYTPVRDESGRIAGFFCACTEITGRVLAERALTAERDRCKSVLDNMGDAFVLLDPDFRIVDMNAEAMRLESRPREAILGKTHWEAHPTAAPELGELYRRAMTERRQVSLEHRYVWPDGRDTWIDMRAYPASGGLAVFYRDITEAKRTSAALERNEAFSRGVLAASQDCIKVLGLDGSLETMSEGGQRALFIEDLTPFVGLRWADTFEPDGRAAAHAAVAEARSGGTARFEAGLKTQKGELRWWDTVVSPISAADGRPEKLLALSRDIADRKTAEARLHELNATLERRVAERTAERDRAWNNARDLLLVVGDDGVFRAVNPAWTSILGWSEDELVGRGFLDFIHPDDHPSSEDALEVASKQNLSAYENRYRHKDGSYRDISWVTAPEEGLIYASGRDVTAEKTRATELQATEAARRQADALYRAYFENTAEALFVVSVLADGGFAIDDLNPAHQASIGMPLADVGGKRVDEVLPAELAEQVSSHYRRVLETGEVYQYRETFRLGDKDTYWDTVLVPVRDTDGRIVRLIGASRDLTRQLAAEEQLRQSQKMEAMGQLTGGVAHDFNNLLTPIVGSLDMLVRRGLGNERERRLIDGALQSAERAKTLVQRLLAFARRQPLQPVPVDLKELLNGMAGLIGSTVGPQIDIRVELDPELPPARADANQLEMAVLNLAVNARDAMPSGGVLTIRAAREAVRSGRHSKLRQGHYIRLGVADTGLGMDEATLARAIEPFFSTKGIGRGTGLGLSMVHGLASQLGGGLTIESAPGKGTTVELWLPISADAIQEGERSPAPKAGPKLLGTALLVDDEELVRMSTADMLMDLGYEVVEANSAEEALRLVGNGLSPDILVTDHLMPGMTGVELASALRSTRPALPILIVSGYAQDEGIAPSLPRLTKPFRNAEFAAILAEVMTSTAG